MRKRRFESIFLQRRVRCKPGFRQASGRSSTPADCPIFDVLAGRFAPDLASIPDITVALARLQLYDELGTIKAADPSDTARVELLLAELRLPAIKQVWASLAAQADKEGWPAARFLAALAEHELAERTLRRIKAISPKPGCRRLSPGVAAAIGTRSAARSYGSERVSSWACSARCCAC